MSATQPDPGAASRVSELFHENSKLRGSDTTIFRWISFVNDDESVRRTISRPARHYRGYPACRLPGLDPSEPGSFESVALSRRSAQMFSGESVDLAALSKILYLGGGITDQRSDGTGSTLRMRVCPSGGALYPLDIYCAAHAVEGLESGLHYYDPLDHALRRVRDGDFRPEIGKAMWLDSVPYSAACLMITATFRRTTFKYGERGYRFVLLEAGHVAQNLLLAAHAAGLVATPVGGFVDDDLNALVGLDGVNEAVIYSILVGGRQQEDGSSESHET